MMKRDRLTLCEQIEKYTGPVSAKTLRTPGATYLTLHGEVRVTRMMIEAEPEIERLALVEAQLRAATLLDAAQKLYSYLSEEGGFGDPGIIEEVWRHADGVRHAMNTAISVRRARMRAADKAKEQAPVRVKRARAKAA